MIAQIRYTTYFKLIYTSRINISTVLNVYFVIIYNQW